MASLKKRKEQIRDTKKKEKICFFFQKPFFIVFREFVPLLVDKQKKMLSYYHLTLLKLIYQRINLPKTKENKKGKRDY